MKSKRYISLAESLEKGVVIIDETGDVNRLMATNHSDKDDVFIQSGDMVKGGGQVRTLSHHAVLPPQSGKSYTYATKDRDSQTIHINIIAK
jgi:hypothetical protein